MRCQCLLIFLMLLAASARAAGTESAAETSTAPTSATPAPDSAPRLRFGDGDLVLGLRIQTDYVHFADDITPLDDGADARRLRLTLSGKLGSGWDYKYEYDFKPRETTDAFLRYTSANAGSFTIGQFALPISLDDQTSSKWVSFIERSLPALTFAPGRFLGGKYNVTGQQWMLQSSLQFDRIDDEERAGDDPRRYALRVVWSPQHDRDQVLHAGAALVYTDTAGSELAQQVRFRTRPEARIDGTPTLVDTGNLSADHFWLQTLELAGQWGVWSLQAEWIGAEVNGARDYRFDSYALQASWFVSGGQRRYRFNEAQFDKPQLYGPAWELAARLSEVDLDDADRDGGIERNITLGANWYPHASLRFSLNLIRARIDKRLAADESLNILALRAQLTF